MAADIYRGRHWRKLYSVPVLSGTHYQVRPGVVPGQEYSPAFFNAQLQLTSCDSNVDVGQT